MAKGKKKETEITGIYFLKPVKKESATEKKKRGNHGKAAAPFKKAIQPEKPTNEARPRKPKK